jgi:hypothetical protein
MRFLPRLDDGVAAYGSCEGPRKRDECINVLEKAPANSAHSLQAACIQEWPVTNAIGGNTSRHQRADTWQGIDLRRGGNIEIELSVDVAGAIEGAGVRRRFSARHAHSISAGLSSARAGVSTTTRPGLTATPTAPHAPRFPAPLCSGSGVGHARLTLQCRLRDWDGVLPGSAHDAHAGAKHAHHADEHQRLVI